MANVSVRDYAGFVETVTVTEMLVKSTSFEITSLTSMTSSISSVIASGKPVQGNVRQLALARWNYMYPSQ